MPTDSLYEAMNFSRDDGSEPTRQGIAQNLRRILDRLGVPIKEGDGCVECCASAQEYLEHPEEFGVRNPFTAQAIVMTGVAAERDRQDMKWGSQRHLHDDVWNRILVEEVGEVSKALNDGEPLSNLQAELYQVAAVAVAWLESLITRPQAELTAGTEETSDTLEPRDFAVA